MATRSYTTNLRCAGCLDAIRPHLDATPGVQSWSVDLGPEKRLTVEGDAEPEAIRAALGKAGYQVVAEAPKEEPASYYPLILILAYLVGVAAAAEVVGGSF